MNTQWDPNWFAGDVPTRSNLVVWEPRAYMVFDSSEPLRDATDPCPGCDAGAGDWCDWDCEGPLDPWNPADNEMLRRYFN
jgi:hypothetical protein